jgi:cobalt/nickel transport system permease protein
MHMADALLSPAVGGAMWVATGATVAYSARRVRRDLDESRIPLMGVAGAFVFAAQMLNFTIPGTGSSGHIGGALLLAILLGPEAAFLVMASVLTVQALFFADGGLLALGANVFNLGFFPAFVAYPLVYRRIVGTAAVPSRRRVTAGSVIAAVVGLQLGALAVVLETTASGITALPFAAFLALMQPIHLAIGVVEGLATAVVVMFVMRAQPDLLAGSGERRPRAGRRLTPVLAGLAVAAVIAGAALSWFASSNADGLEWSIARVVGANEELTASSSTHQAAEKTQAELAILPDYGFKPETAQEAAAPSGSDDEGAWPAVSAGTSVSGLAGAAITLLVAGALGLVLRRRSLARSRAGD